MTQADRGRWSGDAEKVKEPFLTLASLEWPGDAHSVTRLLPRIPLESERHHDQKDEAMTRRDAVALGSRMLAVLLTVWALTEVTYLPGSAHSFLRYASQVSPNSASEYYRHSYLIALGFRITRIVGYVLMSMWLYRCGQDIEDLLLPASLRDQS
jgi:hypothetical protein